MGKDLTQVSTTFYICDGGSCRKAGSDPVMRATRAYLRNQGLPTPSKPVVLVVAKMHLRPLCSQEIIGIKISTAKT